MSYKSQEDLCIICYRDILRKYPNHSEAQAGLQKIEARYVKWIERALNQGKQNKAKQHITRLRKVNPNSPRLAQFQKRISKIESYRYIDNGNGTVTDKWGGLIWLKNANCFSKQDWEGAKKLVAKLKHGKCGLRDGSRRGSWRLPTKEELAAIVDDRYTNPAISNATGTGQWKENDVFLRVQNYYWTSTKFVWTLCTNQFKAHYVRFYHGKVGDDCIDDFHYVWPVRGR
jgi:hypothetical protein